MTALARLAWAAGAVFFATLLASIAHVDYLGLSPKLLLLAFTLLAAVRPVIALHVLAAAVPIASYVAQRRWNVGLPWSEALVCAALTGLCAHAAVTSRTRLPWPVRTPALLFGVVVAAAVVAALGVPALRLGPGFRDALATQLTREYFTDSRGFPALHTGMLLLEGVLLFTFAARHAAGGAWERLAGIAAMTVIGATLAASQNLARLHQAASRADDLWTAIVHLSRTVRFNVHYADYNAAGSYFAMAALAAIALALAVRATLARVIWIACAATILAGLWLTASRAAYLALILAMAGAVGTAWLLRSGRRVAAVSTVAAAAIAVALIVALTAPMRGNQHSSFMAVDTRVGMAAVAARMIGSRPAFGIGPGEFQQRSGEFATPELIAKFPVAVHENAHNNFLQIAAELGLIGGAAFVWLVGAALFFAGRGSTTQPARLLVAFALAAFVFTWLAGHPLLVPEPAYAFWILLGAAAGAGVREVREVREVRGVREVREVREVRGVREVRKVRGVREVLAVCGVVAILASVPWRMQALINDADLEHIGIGVSPWHVAPDAMRYREARGHATLFVPAGAFKFDVNPRTDAPVRLEIKLDGRVADVVTLAPQVWNNLSLPARKDRSTARFVALDLRILEDDQIGMWITKVEPIR